MNIKATKVKSFDPKRANIIVTFNNNGVVYKEDSLGADPQRLADDFIDRKCHLFENCDEKAIRETLIVKIAQAFKSEAVGPEGLFS